jgi:hypothetical protein
LLGSIACCLFKSKARIPGARRRTHQSLLEILEVAKPHRYLEAPLGHRLPCAAAQRFVHCRLRCRPHHAFVVEESYQIIERPCIDRLGHVQVAARAQHTCCFGQRLRHQRPWHVVQ